MLHLIRLFYSDQYRMKPVIVMKTFFLTVLTLLLFSCASQPPSDVITRTPDNEITLAEAVQNPSVFDLSTVRWGGRVLSADYVSKDKTGAEFLRVEIANYPLDDKGKPLSEASAGARFIVRVIKGDEAFDELGTKVFKRNAFVTVVGKFVGVEKLLLDNGQSQSLAVVKADDYYRWSYDNNRSNNSGVSFGIGIGISL